MRLSLLISFLIFFSLLTGSVWAASGCLVAECHATFGKARYVHAPVAENDCASCHEAVAGVHPGAGSMLLVEPEPQLCLQCHEDPAAEMAFPHSALKQGCTGCHSPHQGDLPALVLQSGGKLCLACHGPVMDGKRVKVQGYDFADGVMDLFGKADETGMHEQTIYGLADGIFDLFGKADETGIVVDLYDVDDCTPEAKYVHGPVAAGSCYMCHGTHGSDNRAMLILPGNGTCVACHPGIKEISDNAVSQHEPVANGNCWDCHTPHMSNYRPLLKAFYPREFYVPYEDENYSLCFECHDNTAFTYEITSEATNFRNRNANLHYFHVNRPDKGRVCNGCHGIHGGDQDKLLMSKIPDFGRWDIPLKWVSLETRATCYVGCHSRKTYDRETWIRNL